MKTHPWLGSALIILSCASFLQNNLGAQVPDGSFIKGSGPTIWFISGGQRHAINHVETWKRMQNTDSPAFQQESDATVNSITRGSDAEVLLVSGDGHYLKGSDSTIWYISGGQKHKIRHVETWKAMQNTQNPGFEQVDDGVLNAIPSGIDEELLQKLGEGSYIKGSGPEIWYVSGGQRHWIPDVNTWKNMQNTTSPSFQQVDDDVLGSIPPGDPAKQIPFPKRFTKHDDFGSFHIQTDITISRNGTINCITETSEHTYLHGDDAAVKVYFLDKDHNILAQSDMQKFSVTGKSDSKPVSLDTWTTSIPTDEMNNIEDISILQVKTTGNTPTDIFHNLTTITDAAQKFGQALNTNSAGGSSN
jgi:hypothetical protein